MPYNFYRVESRLCRDCAPCARHRHPEIYVGKHYFRRNDDGTDTPITEAEYNSGTYRYRDGPGNRPG